MTPQNVLVIAAHPDDEMLGSCGAVAQWIQNGAAARALIVSTGATARDDAKPGDIVRLQKAARKAAEMIDMSRPAFLNLPDNRLDSIDRLKLIKLIEGYLKSEQAGNPDMVLTHWPGDLNVDHRRVAEAVLVATRPAVSCVKQVLFFETPSSTEWNYGCAETFRPNYYVQCNGDRKIEVLWSCYSAELRRYPHPRSLDAIKALGVLRGNEIGKPFAEAFMLARGIF